jgi:hypothetical protein
MQTARVRDRYRLRNLWPFLLGLIVGVCALTAIIVEAYKADEYAPMAEQDAASVIDAYQGADAICAWRVIPAGNDVYQCFAGTPHGVIEVTCTTRPRNDCRAQMAYQER